VEYVVIGWRVSRSEVGMEERLTKSYWGFFVVTVSDIGRKGGGDIEYGGCRVGLLGELWARESG